MCIIDNYAHKIMKFSDSLIMYDAMTLGGVNNAVDLPKSLLFNKNILVLIKSFIYFTRFNAVTINDSPLS